jgi:ABC-2 type transport system ATP-binding protein
MIKVENLRKTFGAITAVDDMSFEIGTGEVVAFLGPNGAGKTTAMRCITGFYVPDRGSVTIDGIPVLERPVDAQRHIGYLPENNPLYKDMLVSEFLTLSANLKAIPKSEREAAFDFVVSAVGIDDVWYRPLGQLSKGYKQRVGIATALVHKPRILIMDEPTEGLDPIQRAEIRQLIKDLAADHTIIMSTHVMHEAQAVSNRVIIVNKGKVAADGSAAELQQQAKSERVLTVEIEGTGVEKVLAKLDGVATVACEDVEPVSANGSKNGSGGGTATAVHPRTRATVTLTKGEEIRPELARIARERAWVIWHLSEAQQGLEDIFYQLTSDES